MKPSALGFVAIALCIAVARSRGRRSAAIASFGIATLALPVAVYAYFVAKGGAHAVTEIMRADRAYIEETRWVRSAHDLWLISLATFTSFNPFSTLLLGASVERVARAGITRSLAPLRRFALPAATTVAAYVGIAAQLKFYRYHTVLFVGPGVLLALSFASELWASWEISAAKGATILSLVTLASFPLAGANASNWFDETAAVVGLVDGALTHEDFDRRFFAPKLYYDFADSAACGVWLREHTSPDDTIAVRGFEAEIYAIAQRRFTGRFFWTIPLTDPQRTFKRDEWLAEDLATLKASPPRYVVALVDAHAAPEGAQYFLSLGYRQTIVFGRLAVLARPVSDPAQN